MARDTTLVLQGDNAYRDGRLTRQARISIIILTFITFVGNFTQLQLTSALPEMVAEFHVTVSQGQWLTSIFQLVMGIMVPLTAYLTRRFTTRAIMLTSVTCFTIGSALAWVAPSFSLVLLGRLFEAAGSGVTWPVLQIVVFTVFPVTKRGAAMGTVGVAMAVAPAFGPTLGGWQTETMGWRAIFATLTAVGFFCMIAVAAFLHNFNETSSDISTDYWSVTLSVLGFGGAMFGFTNINRYHLTHPVVAIPLVVGIVCIIWFVLRQLRLPEPLLDLSVFTIPAFTVGTIIASLTFFAFTSITVLMPLFIQNDRGFTATFSGLIMLPGAIGMGISQFFGGKALDRFGTRPVALWGSTVLFLGSVLLTTISLTSPIWIISIAQLIRQIGMGFLLMPVTTWSLNNLPNDKVASGSSLTNTARQIAGAVGTTVLVIVMSMLSSLHQRSGASLVESNVFGTIWSLRISTFICGIIVFFVLFGVYDRDIPNARFTTIHALRKQLATAKNATRDQINKIHLPK